MRVTPEAGTWKTRGDSRPLASWAALPSGPASEVVLYLGLISSQTLE